MILMWVGVNLYKVYLKDSLLSSGVISYALHVPRTQLKHSLRDNLSRDLGICDYLVNVKNTYNVHF